MKNRPMLLMPATIILWSLCNYNCLESKINDQNEKIMWIATTRKLAVIMITSFIWMEKKDA
jgi:hypothetical protein